MEIVDAQVHLNRLGRDWERAPAAQTIETAVTAMDAVGVDAVLIGEYPSPDAPPSGEVLSNGVIRHDYAFSKLAVSRYPERFAYYVAVDRRDPDVDGQVAAVRTNPGALCLRVTPGGDELQPFVDGAYQPIFAAAEKHAVPVFVALLGRTHLIEPYARTFPDLQIILDHFPILFARDQATVSPAERFAEFDRALPIAHLPNVAVKISHAPDRISAESYPFRDLVPHMRRIIDAFSPQRVMWASDYTQIRPRFHWAEVLYYLLDWHLLSDDEAEWIFARTARTLLRWPKPGSP